MTCRSGVAINIYYFYNSVNKTQKALFLVHSTLGVKILLCITPRYAADMQENGDVFLMSNVLFFCILR